MCNDKRRYGGYICVDAFDALREVTAAPQFDGTNVSWLNRCIVGDNQGQEGACSIFAMANWAEIVHGRRISDEECLDTYRKALGEKGRNGGGLNAGEAFAAACKAQWLPGARAIKREWDFSALKEQPMLAAYAVTTAWENVSVQGCLDHGTFSDIRGFHMVLIVARGHLTGLNGGPWVYVENSWSDKWGWNGIGVMSEELHTKLCREMWTIL